MTGLKLKFTIALYAKFNVSTVNGIREIRDTYTYVQK